MKWQAIVTEKIDNCEEKVPPGFGKHIRTDRKLDILTHVNALLPLTDLTIQALTSLASSLALLAI